MKEENFNVLAYFMNERKHRHMKSKLFAFITHCYMSSDRIKITKINVDSCKFEPHLKVWTPGITWNSLYDETAQIMKGVDQTNHKGI